MVQSAIEELLEQLRAVPGPEDDRHWQGKADILCEFAGMVSSRVVEAVGIRDPDMRDANLLAVAMVRDMDPENPVYTMVPDFVGSSGERALYLYKIRADLTTTQSDYDQEHLLLFCRGRVVEWNVKTQNSIKRVLTYDEAAVFVVLWFAEKLLQILRKNKWERVSDVAGIYDSLLAFVTQASNAPRPLASLTPKQLQSKLGLHYDPQQLLRPLKDEFLGNKGIHYYFEVVQLTESQYEALGPRDPQSRRNYVSQMKNGLGYRRLEFGMDLPAEVLFWCKSKLGLNV